MLRTTHILRTFLARGFLVNSLWSRLPVPQSTPKFGEFSAMPPHFVGFLICDNQKFQNFYLHKQSIDTVYSSLYITCTTFSAIPIYIDIEKRSVWRKTRQAAKTLKGIDKWAKHKKRTGKKFKPFLMNVINKVNGQGRLPIQENGFDRLERQEKHRAFIKGSSFTNLSAAVSLPVQFAAVGYMLHRSNFSSGLAEGYW